MMAGPFSTFDVHHFHVGDRVSFRGHLGTVWRVTRFGNVHVDFDHKDNFRVGDISVVGGERRFMGSEIDRLEHA